MKIWPLISFSGHIAAIRSHVKHSLLSVCFYHPLFSPDLGAKYINRLGNLFT